MGKYEIEGSQRIVADLRYTSSQLSLVGKLISLEKETGLAKSVRLNYSSTSSAYLGKVVVLSQLREIDIDVALQLDLANEDHKQLEERIRVALKKCDVGVIGLFSYCQKSYGLDFEQDRVMAHFGFYL